MGAKVGELGIFINMYLINNRHHFIYITSSISSVHLYNSIFTLSKVDWRHSLNFSFFFREYIGCMHFVVVNFMICNLICTHHSIFLPFFPMISGIREICVICLMGEYGAYHFTSTYHNNSCQLHLHFHLFSFKRSSTYSRWNYQVLNSFCLRDGTIEIEKTIFKINKHAIKLFYRKHKNSENIN